jgi:hypothetical protein
MRKLPVVPFVVGLIVIAIAVAGVMYMQRGAHVEVTGSVLKVRTLELDDKSSLAVVDFRVTNPSDYNYVVRTVEVTLQDTAGKIYDSSTISEADIRRVFEYHPLLGKQYNASLVLKDKIGPRTTEDRMIAARFEMPEAQLQKRAHLALRIEEIDGLKSDIVEVRK